MDAVISVGSWRLRARVALGFLGRWRGLRDQPLETCLLLRTRSVHGFGMDRDLLVVAIDAEMRILGSRVLHPNRLLWFADARYLLEMPLGLPVPEVGTLLSISAADG